MSRNYKELHFKNLAKEQKNGGAFAPRTEERSDGTSRGGGRPRPPARGQSRFARPSRHVGSETGRLQPRVSHVLPVPVSEANDSHSSVPTGDDDESSFGFRDKPQACSLKFCDSLSKAAKPPAPESMAASPPFFNRRIRKNTPKGLSRNYKELHSKDLAKKQKNGGAFAPGTDERSVGAPWGGGRPRPPA